MEVIGLLAGLYACIRWRYWMNFSDIKTVKRASDVI
jgi:hypothetical protein